MIISVSVGKASVYFEDDGAPSPDTIDMLVTKAATTALSVYRTRKQLDERSAKHETLPVEED